jgi:hypothetical protein
MTTSHRRKPGPAGAFPGKLFKGRRGFRQLALKRRQPTGRDHLHDLFLAETPASTEFSTGDEAFSCKLVNGPEMDLQQFRDL